jgi:hypothetical protein
LLRRLHLRPGWVHIAVASKDPLELEIIMASLVSRAPAEQLAWPGSRLSSISSKVIRCLTHNLLQESKGGLPGNRQFCFGPILPLSTVAFYRKGGDKAGWPLSAHTQLCLCFCYTCITNLRLLAPVPPSWEIKLFVVLCICFLSLLSQVTTGSVAMHIYYPVVLEVAV